MKIVGFTMMTNPEYRQDAWEECVRQALEVFDKVAIVYGRREDGQLIKDRFGTDLRIISQYLDWPQPEWSYEELPRHLNAALALAKYTGADWAVKFDTDYFFHERYKSNIYQKLAFAKNEKRMIAHFGKLQFFQKDRAYEKGRLYIALNLKAGVNLVYGQDRTRYTDLCQPIIWDGKETIRMPGGTYDIPIGDPVPERQMASAGGIVFNYDYTFKTYERAKELLYHFDRSHARWWRHGYTGKELSEITPETAMEDYLRMSEGRVARCIKHVHPSEHPKCIQARLAALTPDHFGHSLWGMIPLKK